MRVEKPLSVKAAGYAVLIGFGLLLGLSVGAGLKNHIDLPAELAAISVFLMLFGGAWWMIGTMIHRSRLNRTRYLAEAMRDLGAAPPSSEPEREVEKEW